MSYQVLVAGKVHSIDPIISERAYAKATFNTMDNLVVDAYGKVLSFQYTKPFIIDSIDDVLESIITSSTNVEWDITICPAR